MGGEPTIHFPRARCAGQEWWRVAMPLPKRMFRMNTRRLEPRHVPHGPEPCFRPEPQRGCAEELEQEHDCRNGVERLRERRVLLEDQRDQLARPTWAIRGQP